LTQDPSEKFSGVTNMLLFQEMGARAAAGAREGARCAGGGETGGRGTGTARTGAGRAGAGQAEAGPAVAGGTSGSRSGRESGGSSYVIGHQCKSPLAIASASF